MAAAATECGGCDDTGRQLQPGSREFGHQLRERRGYRCRSGWKLHLVEHVTIDGKAITLQGAGIDSTVITDGIASGGASQADMFVWITKNTGKTRDDRVHIQRRD